MVRTPFFAAAVREPQHPAYDGNPAIRRTDIPLEERPGDQDKVAAAIVRIGDLDAPPRRQLLGSDAYALVRDALTQRLADVESQREFAVTTDADDLRP
jgi:hypothetical protein